MRLEKSEILDKVERALTRIKNGESPTSAARNEGLPRQTLITYLDKAKIPRPTSAQKGLAVLQGRAKNNTFVTYRSYFSYEKVLMVAEILQRNGLNRTKTEVDLTSRLGKTAKQILDRVFPAYLVESIGLEKCVDNYKAWLDTNPKSGKFVPTNEQKAREQLLKIIKTELEKDPEIKDKVLFLKISFELLIGKSIPQIGEEYKLLQAVILGIRNRLGKYFLNHESKNKVDLTDLINETKFSNSSPKRNIILDPAKRAKIIAELANRLSTRLAKPTSINSRLVRTLTERTTGRTINRK